MRKRTVRKVWRTDINPVLHAIQGAAITPRAELDKLLMREMSSLEAISKGRGGLREWHDLCAANNLAEELARMGIGKSEVLPIVESCQWHLVDAARRFQNTGRMGLTGSGIQALREMLQYHDLQRASIPRAQYEDAIRRMTAKVQSGHNVIDLNEELGAPK